jgi:hypothetical protein
MFSYSAGILQTRGAERGENEFNGERAALVGRSQTEKTKTE